MTKQVQRRRGTATQHTSFTGAEGELSVNTTNKSVHVHDNVTAGGFEAARADMDNVTSSSILTAAGITATTTELNYVDGVTSSIQTQLDGKAGTASPTFTGTLTTANLTATGTTTLAGASTSADITFGDNDKAVFGAGSDLQIYHDGSNSYIKDAGTGNLVIGADTFTYIGNPAGTTTAARFNAGGAQVFNHNNSQKLATTSTGVDITGTLTSDGLTVDGDAKIKTGGPARGLLVGVDLSNSDSGLYYEPSGRLHLRGRGGYPLEFNTAATAGTNLKRMDISSNGDISFYDSLGSSQSFFWDASAESLGIGTTSPSSKLHVNGGDIQVSAGNSLKYSSTAYITPEDNSIGARVQGTSAVTLWTSSSERMRLDASGNVGIGTSSPSAPLHVDGAGLGDVYSGLIENTTTDTDHYNVVRWMQGASGSATGYIGTGGSTVSNTAFRNNFVIGTQTNNDLVFASNDTERMRLDASGNVGIGTSNVGYVDANRNTLQVNGSTSSIIALAYGGANAGYMFADASITQLWSEGSRELNIGTASAGPITFKTNNTERMRVDGNGDIQIGKTDGSQNTQGIILNSYGTIRANSQTNEALHLIRSTAGNIARFYHNNTTLVGNINVTSSSTAYNTSSDYRLKENVVDLTGATTRLKQLAPKRFNFIVDADTTVDGFLAHEVQSVVPEAITGTHNEVDDDGNPVYQGIDQSKLVPLLVATIKELEARITALENA